MNDDYDEEVEEEEVEELDDLTPDEYEVPEPLEVGETWEIVRGSNGALIRNKR